MSGKSDHYFLAIPLPEEARRILAHHVNVLKEELPYKEWTYPDDLHITLTFLGAANFQRINELKQAVTEKVEEHPSISLTLNGLGTFGQNDRPRVLWAGVSSDSHLYQLQKQIHEAAEQVGFQVDKRPYKPHITLAKKWAGSDVLNPKCLETEVEKLSWEVKGVILYRTLLGRSPKYQPLKVFTF